MTSSSCQLCNSQNIVNNFMDLQFFLKNVNKQLKSADFLSEKLIFQKISLKKVLAIFVLISKHTIILNIHLYKGNDDKISDLVPPCPFVI